MMVVVMGRVVVVVVMGRVVMVMVMVGMLTFSHDIYTMVFHSACVSPYVNFKTIT